jgi:carboxypeptidase PM20D1
VAEKGFCNYEISVEDEGGHSSMPPLHTAPGKAALLIREIEGHPLPSRLTPPLAGMLRNIAGETSFPVRMVLANLWLFKPLLFKMFSANSTTRAMVRSTFAVTMARSGDAPNVLPRKAKFTVNARLLQGDTVESAAAYLDTLAKKVFRRLKENQGEGAKSPGFTITPRAAENPSAVSPASGKLYEKIKIIIAELCPDAVISPYLVTGGTDARKYSSITEHVYRFTPILVTNEEKNTIHNTNESISVENYGRMILFYRRLIEGFDKP